MCKHKLKTTGKLEYYKDRENIKCFDCDKRKVCQVKCLCGDNAEIYLKKLDIFVCMRCSV